MDQSAEPPIALHIDFTEPIRLAGYALLKHDTTWEVDLWWKTSGMLVEDYHVFVHLIGADGALSNGASPNSNLVAQHDHIAGADAYPTSYWPPGTFLRDRFFLNVPGGVCEDCVLRIGLYTETERLPLRNSEDHVEIVVE